ncbi:MAG: YicC family protein [Proteobacteria bacterium]|nr:MAG: YicC family protein [Pseudomonadota bacterium]
MIRSMTGFGHAGFAVEEQSFEAEVRSVNHRHLDVRVRLPHGLTAFEGEVRQLVAERLDRGKVDLSVHAVAGATSGEAIALDLAAAEQYLRAARELRERHGVPGELDVRGLLGLPGVARVVERVLPEENLRRALAGGVGAALDGLAAMRAAEGASIERDLRARLARVEAIVADVESRAADVQRAVRDRLRKRAEQLRDETGLLDEARLHQEIVFAADRLDITEETVRLHSHVAQFRTIVDAAGPGQPAGRRLDFLLQEMGREINTIGSKGNDAPIAHQVVELKTELERLREQVQNVE